MKIKKIDRSQNIITIGNEVIQLDCNYWDIDFDEQKDVIKLFEYGVKNIRVSNDKSYCSNKIGLLEYDVIACVVDIERKIVRLFDLFIELDSYFPYDVSINDYVCFKVMRFDVI